jgi:hypothetical protein
MSSNSEEFIVVCIFVSAVEWYLIDPMQPGDIVAVRHGVYGRKEGLVVGSHIDYTVRAEIFFCFQF